MSAGYEFVPFPAQVQRCERPNAVWHRRCPETFTGTLHVTLRTEQDVHVGSGRKRMQGNDLVRGAARVRGRPGIPGSTLKGVLRSRYEAITASCAPRPGNRPVKSKSRTHEDVELAQLTPGALALPVFEACRPASRMCPVCALFGLMSLRGRVAVGDFLCEDGVAFSTAPLHEQFSPRLHHVGVARVGTSRDGAPCFQVGPLHGRKFAVGMGPRGENAQLQMVEVIPAESNLRGSLRLFNATRAELGGLLSALGHGPGGRSRSALKVGAGKGRGLGRVRLRALTFELRDAGGRKAEIDQATAEAWYAEFAQSPDCFADGERRLHEIHQGGC
jgi:CRISPR/Cas system CSM-associated protein Csm3 (group 7 of RAMP superfamily)